MGGYDFRVRPVEVPDAADYQARADQAKARKIELQQRQIELDQAKKAQTLQVNQQNAARAAYQPQADNLGTVQAGGASIPMGTAYGPAQFNRGSYIQNLQQSDPLGAQQAEQQFQQQDFQHQQQMAQLNEGLAKASKEQLANLQTSLELQGRYFGAVDAADPKIQPQIYAQARQHAIQAGVPGAEQTPEQFDPQAWQVMKSQFMDVKQAADLANKRLDQQITMRGQDMTASTAAAGQKVTMRGQNMVDARTKENQGSQVMQVPQPDGTVKLVRVKVGDAVPQGAKTTAAAQKEEEAATVDEKKKADLVTNAKENLAALRGIIIRRPELFGPYAGRLTSLRAAAGTSDEDISKLAGIKDRFGMVNQGLHSMRSASHVAEAGDAVLNKMRNSPEATLAAINEAEKSLETFQRPVAEQRGNLTGNKKTADPLGIR
jgi:hypothetical protein